MSKTAPRLIYLLLLAISFTGCYFYDSYQRAKQIRTFTDMQAICSNIEKIRFSGHWPPGESRIESILSGVGEGRDSWNHRWVYVGKSAVSGFSYVLVSYGDDGEAEVEDANQYFSLSEKSIQGQTEKDIVFRDGRPITLAGK